MPHIVDYSKLAADSWDVVPDHRGSDHRVPNNRGPDHRGPTTNFVSTEAELGCGLNQALNRGQRANFSYLLAMLSDNVVEHSAFTAFRKVEPVSSWTPPFAVGSQVPIQSTSAEFDQSPTALFAASRSQWRLQQALHPAGLHPLNDAKHIPALVVANCAHYVQQRLREAATPGGSVPPVELLDVVDRYRGVERAVA